MVTDHGDDSPASVWIRYNARVRSMVRIALGRRQERHGANSFLPSLPTL
jgi:hypothetical protein